MQIFHFAISSCNYDYAAIEPWDRRISVAIKHENRMGTKSTSYADLHHNIYYLERDVSITEIYEFPVNRIALENW